MRLGSVKFAGNRDNASRTKPPGQNPSITKPLAIMTKNGQKTVYFIFGKFFWPKNSVIGKKLTTGPVRLQISVLEGLCPTPYLQTGMNGT